MCGIAGLILEAPDLRGADWLTAMTQRMVHRGPDSGGAVVFGPGGDPTVRRELGQPDDPVGWAGAPCALGLGARRLAVIDTTDAGRQPMSAPDGHAWIVFNGEIYNHEALRRELANRGLAFTSRCDTEVFLAAYRAWGCECFARLEGMWAAAIVDWASRRVVLSRDRFGIKPLYMTAFSGGLAFGSEIKALLEVPFVDRQVNEARLLDFLSDGLVDHTDDTLFDGIWSAPAACWIEIDLRATGSLRAAARAHRYWFPRFGWTGRPDWPDRIRASFRDAVRSHLCSDVPIGSCLSGGVDSSAIVCTTHALAREDAGCCPNWTQHAFTAVLPDSALDERRHARTVVDACPGVVRRDVEPTPARLLDDMASLVRHQEQPFGSPSIYMQWEVMRLARSAGVTVLLDGQGGDELFCGYEGYWPPYLAHLARHGRLLSAGRGFVHAARSHFGAGALVAHTIAHLTPTGVRRRLRRGWRRRRQDWLVRDLFDAADPPDLFETLHGAPPSPAAPRGPALSRHLWTVLLRDSLPSLLRFEDRNSMAFSIEARVPFLDHRFVELAMDVPPDRKLRRGRMKAAFRDATRGVVPDAILDRRDKIGFAAPTAAWMRGGLSDWWRDLIGSRAYLERGCFDATGTRDLVARFDQGDDSASAHLWRLAIVEQWARQCLDRAG